MADVKIDDRELVALMRKIERVGKGSPSIIRKMLSKIGSLIHGRAVTYAPRSATKAEYVSTLKRGVTRRKTSSFTSGSLKSSITVDVKRDRVEIGVPSNSKAGEYAEKIHDEKGKTWNNLGKHNDRKATDKYIFKAYEDSERAINKELNQLLDDITKGILT